MSRWYVLHGKKEQGPFSKAQLSSLAQNLRITPETLIRKGDSGPWIIASEVGDLFSSGEPSPKPPRTRGKRAARTAPPSRSGSHPIAEHWKLLVAIGGTAFGSAAIAVVACIILLGGDAQPAPNVPVEVASAAADSDQAEPATDSTVVEVRKPALATTEPKPQGMPVQPPVQPELEQSDPSVMPVENVPAEDPAADDGSNTSPPEEQGEGEDANPPQQVAEALPKKPDIDPKPLLPPIPEVKSEITDEEIRDFDESVRHELRARDAFARYEVFVQSFEFTDEQREHVDAELAQWTERADEDLYRLGSDWVTLDEVRQVEEEAERLFDQAIALARIGSWDACVEKLEDANRANPNGIKAPYVLGLIWSLPFTGIIGPENAEKWFRTVLLRHPRHAGALNSIAIAQIKQGEHNPALTNLAEAAELSDSCPEVIQNLGRFVFLVESGRIEARGSTLGRYTDLYAQLVAEGQGPEFDSRHGWFHMEPVFPEREREEDGADSEPVQVAAGGERLVPHGGGSGFVVAPGYILTNRHVVYDNRLGIADAVGISDPSDPGVELSGKGVVVEVSETDDLALVEVHGLQSPPLAIRPEQVPLATDVLVLGYPRTDEFGVGLKTARGIISGLPDASRPSWPGYYLFDAISDHGNSGGPIVDRTGGVLAVLTMGYGQRYREMNALEADFSGGVPSPRIIEFVVTFAPELHLEIAGDGEEFGDWAELTEAVKSSAFRLTVYYKAGAEGLHLAAQEAGYQRTIWEDHTCPTCNGRTRLPCPRRGCIRGEVSVRYYQYGEVGVGRNRIPVRVPRFRKETCPVCDGASSLDCPDCVNGVDSYLH